MNIQYQIIQTGSKGNAVLYFDEILIDVGLNFKRLEPWLKKVKIILLILIFCSKN